MNEPDFTEIDLREIERERDLPPDEPYDGDDDESEDDDE